MSVNFLIYTSRLVSVLFVVFLIGCSKQESELPSGFVFLTDVDPTVIESPRYSTKENFLGRVVSGYTSHRIICTKEAAEKLKLVHSDLKKQGYKLVVYDGYRPQRAVNEFMRWSKDEADQAAKAYYYPTIDKKDVFKLGYVAEKSGHSRGSTLDLTIIKDDKAVKPIKYSKRKLLSGKKIPFLDDNTVDMGASFDLFHEASHHDSKLVSAKYLKNRNLLRNAMKAHGFKDYQEEWWHYTLANEPYPDAYFDFVLEN